MTDISLTTPALNAATLSTAGEANSYGMRALNEGAFDAAIAYFERAAALDPEAGPLWRNLATAHRNKGDAEGERAALEQALDCDRTDFMAWLRKAELHERLGETTPAMTAWSGVLQMAVQFDPLPEGLAPVLDHAQRYVAEQGARISDHIESRLGADIDDCDETSRRRLRAFAAVAAGKRRIYHNECLGLNYPFLPADEFFDNHHFPWFAAIGGQTDAIRAELVGLIENGAEAMRPYVRMEKGTPDNKWSGLDHNLDWTACFLWEYGQPNLPVLERCPATRAAIEMVPRADIPGRAPNVFFSILRPHAHIPPHTGVSNTRAIIHLPLIVPEGCGFRVGGETRQWVEGQAFAFDDTIEHEAWNNSDQLRAVLIFDVWNPHLSKEEQDMIARFYAETDTAGLDGPGL